MGVMGDVTGEGSIALSAHLDHGRETWGFYSSEALENNAEPKEGRFVFTVDSFVKKVSVVITGCRGTVIPASRRLEI